MGANVIIGTLLKTVLLPMVTAAALGAGLARVTASPIKRDLAAAAALCVGFLVGFSALGEFHLIPIQVRDWLPHAALAPLLILAIPNALGRAALFTPMLGLFLWLHFKPLLASRGLDAVALPMAVAAVLWLLVAAVQHPRNQEAEELTTQPSTWLYMVISTTTVSLICVLDGSVTIGQITGSFAAVCGALFLVNLKLPAVSPGPAAHAVYILVLGCLLLNAHIYVEVDPIGVFLAVAAALAPAWRLVPFYRTMPPLRQTLVLCATALLPMIVAVVYLLLNAQDDPYGY